MICKTTQTGQIVISPSPGKYLSNGETYADSDVYLGLNDSPDNWFDVEELPEIDTVEDVDVGEYYNENQTDIL